jgi:hypothetical protein
MKKGKKDELRKSQCPYQQNVRSFHGKKYIPIFKARFASSALQASHNPKFVWLSSLVNFDLHNAPKVVHVKVISQFMNDRQEVEYERHQ